MELWDLYDRDGVPLGRTVERGRRLKSGEYHVVVHIWVVNSVGRLLIQRRSPRRRLMPNVWAVTSGSAIAGEDSRTAACRELAEELGIHVPPEQFISLGRLVRRNSLCDLWLVKRDVAVPDMKLQREEVSMARWVTDRQLEEMLETRRFHHYGVSYFGFLASALRRETGRNYFEAGDESC